MTNIELMRSGILAHMAQWEATRGALHDAETIDDVMRELTRALYPWDSEADRVRRLRDARDSVNGGMTLAVREFRARLTDEEWHAFRGGICAWQSTSRCAAPRHPWYVYCDEHATLVRDGYGLAIPVVPREIREMDAEQLAAMP